MNPNAYLAAASAYLFTHRPDCKMIADPIIDPQTDPTGGEIVTFGIRVGVHTDKVAESS